MAKTSLWNLIRTLGVVGICWGLFLPTAEGATGKKPAKRVSAPSSGTSSRVSRPVASKPGGKKIHLSSAEEAGGDYVTEKRSDGTVIKYKKKASYDFEGLGLEGMADKPSGAYISNIKDVKARSMVQIRKDFDAEVVESARQMP